MQISKLARSIKPSSTLAITAKANELKARGIDVIGFGAGEPDFDTPGYIKDAAIEAMMQGFTKYTPASGLMSLRKAITEKLQKDNGLDYKPEQIVVNNGAKHALVNAFMAVLNPGDEVVIPAPFWLSYPEMVKMAGGIPKTLKTTKEDGFKVKPEVLEEAITPKTRAMIINSPSNPTGVVYSKEELKALVEVAIKHDLWIVSDEIYEYLVYDGVKHTSVASLSKEAYEHTITINGVSKSYAMTGWRIGYIAAPLEVAKAIGSIQSHATSNANAIAQKAAEAAITTPNTFIKDMVKIFDERRNYMYETLQSIKGLDVIEPKGAFYCFVDVSELYGKRYKGMAIESAADFAKRLLEEVNVALVPCADFEAPSCVRLSYAISLENIQKGLARIDEFIKELQ